MGKKLDPLEWSACCAAKDLIRLVSSKLDFLSWNGESSVYKPDKKLRIIEIEKLAIYCQISVLDLNTILAVAEPQKEINMSVLFSMFSWLEMESKITFRPKYLTNEAGKRITSKWDSLALN